MIPDPLRRVGLLCLFSLAFPSLSAAQDFVPALRIAAAADLQPVLPAVLDAFARQTSIHAAVTYQSSATLAQQIINGAPVDLFLAADTGFPQRVIDAGMATDTKPTIYARGTLVLWARKDATLPGGKPVSMSVLANPALQSVAIANPQAAPYGRAAQATIARLGLTAALAPKLRIAANIAQTAQFADSGNAQIGFLSLTGALTAQLVTDGTFVPVPAADYPPILQGAVVIRNSSGAGNGRLFLQFMSTPAIRSLLQQKGLMPPP